MQTAIITGATSSIGTALISELISDHINVIALVNPGSKKIKYIPTSSYIKIFECKLEDMVAFNLDERYVDACFFHLAWDSSSGNEARSNCQAQVLNVKYSLDAVELAARMGCDTFVGAGSQAEYGRKEEALSETTICNPETAYGIAKLCAGNMTRLACKDKGIRHIWPRILSTYGPRYLPNTVINYTINELLRNREPQLTKGEQVWDFLYSEDCARALYLLAEKGRDGEVYVVGSGESRLLKEYLSDVRDIVNPDINLGLGKKEYSENTVMHLSCDISKLKNDTGFEAKMSFVEGIKRTVEWNQSFMID